MPKEWGFEVHHRKPLEGGGTNGFANLIIMKKDPCHTALSGEYEILMDGVNDVGKSRTIDFPLFDGKVVYDGN